MKENYRTYEEFMEDITIKELLDVPYLSWMGYKPIKSEALSLLTNNTLLHVVSLDREKKPYRFIASFYNEYVEPNGNSFYIKAKDTVLGIMDEVIICVYPHDIKKSYEVKYGVNQNNEQ